MNLFQGACVDIIETLEPNSIDLIFLHLQYGHTQCVWDKRIDLNELWKQLEIVITPSTQLLLMCPTKVGYALIKSEEQLFIYDLVWPKSAPAVFVLRKDADAGKATFVSLLGLDPARARARDLVDAACDALSPYGSDAETLRDAARFVISRKS